MNLFNRQSKIIIGNKEYKSDYIDIDFEVPFSTDKEPSATTISIYNLSPTSISNIKKDMLVSLFAGYGDNIGMLSSGNIVDYTTSIESVDKITTIKLGTALSRWSEDKKVNKTYSKGIDTKTILQDLMSNFNVVIGDITLVNNIVYSKGKVVSGRLKDVIKKLVDESKSKMYFDKGRVYIRPFDKGTLSGFVLSGATGLLGSPEKTKIRIGKEEKEGYKIKCLINHNLFVDSIIKLDSKLVKGTFRIIKGKHSSQDWNTEIEVI